MKKIMISPEKMQNMAEKPAPVWNGASRRGAGRQLQKKNTGK